VAALPVPSEKPSPPPPPDRSPGDVRDAKSCIDVSHIKNARYRFRNRCPFAVNFVFSGRNFQRPVEYDSERLGKAPESVWTYSYHGFKPEVVWACAFGAPGCDYMAAFAAAKKLGGQ
jgi:hypothetical protein